MSTSCLRNSTLANSGFRDFVWLSLRSTRLRLFLRSVFIIGVLLHVIEAQHFRLLDVGPPLFVSQLLPAATQLLRNFGVMCVWGEFYNFPPLHLRPYHKGVHRPLDAVLARLLGLRGVAVGRARVRLHQLRPEDDLILVTVETGANANWALR